MAPPDTEAAGSQRLSSVARAFEVIEYLRRDGPATLSEVASALEMPMSTAHVYLSTLLGTEYVTRENATYQCSLRFLQTGGQLRRTMPLYRVARPEIDDLQAETDEYGILGTEQGGHMVLLYKSESPESIDDRATVGTHSHLHSTAIGKSILSTWTEAEIEDLIAEQGLPAETDNTITTRDALARELEEIRERGYAVNTAENHRGLSAVATPIVLRSGDTLGGIAVSGPSSRIGEDRIEEEIVPTLFNKKNIIELGL